MKKLEEVEMGNYFVGRGNGNFTSVGIVAREADLGRGEIAQFPQ